MVGFKISYQGKVRAKRCSTMTSLAVMAFLQRASKVSVGFIRDNWKWLSFFVLALFVWLYIQSIKSDRDDYRNQYQESVRVHNEYVTAQQQAQIARDSQVQDLILRMDSFTKELDRELEDRHKIIDGITTSNNALVDRLRQQTTEAISRYEQMPNTDPAILSKYKSLSKSFDECAGEVTELAAESDRLSTILTSIETSVGGFNKEVESLNQP